ncbi:transcription factor bHLH130 isoform X1 [Lactuca sativa]|uniref:BHLH domain-containing protein n=1 Tax=Lactuca sativa TaxID=4236 RepID=A0A9R1VBD4_LACSA|nr:transcription factor bHLH130 isoform X1 [Lactuca sativa]KAJ0201626.1 hypothetical protein LSAT_V11C600317100 [Lactuca sativa]
MDSDLHHHHHQQQLQQPQQQNMNSGLTRYRSAPSSYFSNLISNGIYGDDDSDPFFNPRVSTTETDQILSRFTSSTTAVVAGSGGDSTSQQIMNQIGGYESQFIDSVKQEQEGVYSESLQQQQQQQPMIYQNQFQPQTDHINRPVSTCSSAMDDSLTTMHLPTNLLRQSSSPAGFFAHLDIDNGYPVMRSMDDFRSSRSNVQNSLLTSTKRLKNEMGFSGNSHTSSGILPRIPENEGKIMEMKNHLKDEDYVTGYQSGSWDDSDILSDSFLKELEESDHNKLSSLNSSQNQNDVGRIRAPTTLVHHLSLPTSTAELSAMDKLLQFQDSVPLRSRAKRGCATHPRSIAERVRRTRISERMRKLQELVPNMDKQTNTADMLDLAVDYIKELQKEAESLSDHHAKCICPHKQKL